MTTDAVGGVWTYALELCHALAPRGVHVVLATMGPAPDPAQRRDAAACPNATLRQSLYQLEWMDDPWADVDRAGEWLLGLEDEFRPDLVHLNGYAHASLPWRAPTCCVAHSCVCSWWQAVKREPAPDRYDRYRAAVARGLRAADAIVAPTHAMADCIVAHYGPLSETVRVIPNARSPHLFRPAVKEPFVLAAGRLWDQAKNVAALDAIAPRLPWPVYVAGDEACLTTSPLLHSHLSHRLGRLTTPEIADYLSRASIYALPARYEPFGLSVLEAAMSACALVLGDIPSLRENWSGAATFVTPDDYDALAHALRRLATDDGRRRSLAELAQDRARAFSPAHMGDAYLHVYQELIGTDPGLDSPAPRPSAGTPAARALETR
jgi:glycosyltransferase involved in cell wall biosynthesis